MTSFHSKFQILAILCLSLVSTSFQSAPVCGNGRVESGEDCDCGSTQNCERDGNNCCKACKFVTRGTTCRNAANSCDVPEFCNGTSAACPTDLKTANGIPCDSNKGYCRKGECRTHTQQCNNLWIGDAYKANDACYKVLNLRGDENGYCSRLAIFTHRLYTPCERKNALCGKLWCDGPTSMKPIDLGFSFSHTHATLNSRRMNCYSAIIYRAQNEQEALGGVLDGTKCGDKMVCENSKCVPLAVAYGGQRTCRNNCNGNGVCNENGNCHCNKGWRCPDCSQSYSGPGGSSDSGLECKPVPKPPCKCSHGSCCKNCQIVAKGTICRAAANSCDVPEYCDGENQWCPSDLKTANGLSCKSNQGYCYQGECRTRDEQCKNLWFGTAFNANDLCYARFNLRGDKHGYCKKHSETSYTPCTPQNVQCGKLWCNGHGRIEAINLGYGNYWTRGTLNSRTIICQSVNINQAAGKPTLGTVLDGTKCGNQKVCKNNACVSLSAAYGAQPKCLNNCNENGVSIKKSRN